MALRLRPDKLSSDSPSAPSGAPVAVPLAEPLDTAMGKDGGPAGSGERNVHRSYGGIVVAIFVAYVAIAIGLTVWRGVNFIEPDRWAIFLLLGAIILGQWKAFLRDWVPFVFLLFGFEFLRGVAGHVVTADGFSREQHANIHVEALITADQALFNGEIPVNWLQDKLYVPGTVHWYDLLAVLAYGLHFGFPLVFAFMLWIGRKDRCWQFTIGLLIMSDLGFVG